MSESKLTVKGIGKISLPPDQIVINITVESRDMDYNTATDLQYEKTEEIKNAVEELGFDKTRLKTSQLNVTADYENVKSDSGKWEKQFAGYLCTHHLTLKFSFDSEKLKWVISAITSCTKANPSFNIYFTVKDKEKNSSKLLEAAVQDAVRKAAVLSSAANVELGNIVSITYNNNDTDFVSTTNMRSALYRGVGMDEEAAPELSVTPEKIRAQTEVTVVWEINS